MKILTHGNVIRFQCESCGCEFLMGEKKTENLGFYLRAVCPECGNECAGHKEQKCVKAEQKKEGE